MKKSERYSQLYQQALEFYPALEKVKVEVRMSDGLAHSGDRWMCSKVRGVKPSQELLGVALEKLCGRCGDFSSAKPIKLGAWSRNMLKDYMDFLDAGMVQFRRLRDFEESADKDLAQWLQIPTEIEGSFGRWAEQYRARWQKVNKAVERGGRSGKFDEQARMMCAAIVLPEIRTGGLRLEREVEKHVTQARALLMADPGNWLVHVPDWRLRGLDRMHIKLFETYKIGHDVYLFPTVVGLALEKKVSMDTMQIKRFARPLDKSVAETTAKLFEQGGVYLDLEVALSAAKKL